MNDIETLNTSERRHAHTALLRDVIYRSDGKSYIALPGQAFPLYDIHEGITRCPTSLWIYAAVIEPGNKFLMDDGNFWNIDSLPQSQQAAEPRPLARLGEPGGVRIINVTEGLPGLPSIYSIDSGRAGVEHHALAANDFVQLQGRCKSTTMSGRRFMPYIYIRNTMITDKIFPDSCKYEMWIPERNWFGLGKEKLVRTDMIRTDIPVMLTAVEKLLPRLGYQKGATVYDILPMYLKMLYRFAEVTRESKLYLGPEVLNGNDVPDMITRQEYDDYHSTYAYDRPIVTRPYKQADIWGDFEEDWTKLKTALREQTFINYMTADLTPMW